MRGAGWGGVTIKPEMTSDGLGQGLPPGTGSEALRGPSGTLPGAVGANGEVLSEGPLLTCDPSTTEPTGLGWARRTLREAREYRDACRPSLRELLWRDEHEMSERRIAAALAAGTDVDVLDDEWLRCFVLSAEDAGVRPRRKRHRWPKAGCMYAARCLDCGMPHRWNRRDPEPCRAECGEHGAAWAAHAL